MSGLWRSNRGSRKIRYLFFLLRKLFPFLFLFISCLLYLLRRNLKTLFSLTTVWEVLTVLGKQSWIVRSSASFQRRQWHPTPVLLPGKSHGWRSLVSCSPWGREESDMTERLHFPFSLSCIGEENGNPLQCSCLENPRDGGAWWAAVYGVTQSQTRLKRLSSSSSSSSFLLPHSLER